DSAVAAETAASEPGAGQEVRSSSGLQNSKIFTKRLLRRHALYEGGGADLHPCNCAIAGNNWLAKRSLATKASTSFRTCSGTSSAAESMMIGACGLSRLISVAISGPFISGMK